MRDQEIDQGKTGKRPGRERPGKDQVETRGKPGRDKGQIPGRGETKERETRNMETGTDLSVPLHWTVEGRSIVIGSRKQECEAAWMM